MDEKYMLDGKIKLTHLVVRMLAKPYGEMQISDGLTPERYIKETS